MENKRTLAAWAHGRKIPVAMPVAVNTSSGFQAVELRGANAPVAEAEVSSEVARKAADGLLAVLF